MYKHELIRSEKYVIPLFDVGIWSDFTNQPNGDFISVVSDNAGDTGKITIFGTKKTGGAFITETLTLNGVTPVKSLQNDWGNIYGAFMGAIDGQTVKAAVGIVTLKKFTGLLAITTIAATKISKGMVALYFNNKDLHIHVVAGNLWKNANAVVTVANGFKLVGTGTNEKFENVQGYLWMISDVTTATVQIEVLKEVY